MQLPQQDKYKKGEGEGNCYKNDTLNKEESNIEWKSMARKRWQLMQNRHDYHIPSNTAVGVATLHSY